jgi:eukaryotic-like serine/threonine-protein kinase
VKIAMRECPNEAAILAFVGGTMGGPARRATEAHLAACVECRALVSELARRTSGVRPAGTAYDPTVQSQPGHEQAPSVLALPGDVIDGKYELEWTIGAGGMGLVVAAWHKLLDRRVAIKFPLPELRQGTEGRGRLLREARACARLRSEHVVRLLDVGALADGSPYVVMEYLIGRTLAERLREDGPLPTGEAVDAIVQACEALEEAHLSGIVHRDLKPSNLFETHRFDGSRVVKVLDFGIAKTAVPAAGDELAATRGAMGSPGYMAPEQLRSTRDVDERADIWALGVSLHELTTGDLPPARAEVLRRQAPGLERIVQRCLEPDPARRFAKARDLAAALAPFGGPVSRGISARLTPGGPPRAIGRTGAPRRGWWMIPVVAVGSALIAGMIAWVMKVRAPTVKSASASTSETAVATTAPVPAAAPPSSALSSVAGPAGSVAPTSSASSAAPTAPVASRRSVVRPPSPTTPSTTAQRTERGKAPEGTSGAGSQAPPLQSDSHGLLDRK